MAVSIEVRARDGIYEATLTEGASRTRHRVTVRPADLARLAPDAPPGRVVEASFRFLLDREPKELILTSFDLSVISRYFPEFERELADYLR